MLCVLWCVRAVCVVCCVYCGVLEQCVLYVVCIVVC